MSDSKTRTMKVMYPKESDADKLAVDQIGLYAHLYSELFDTQNGKRHQSKPWRRGIVELWKWNEAWALSSFKCNTEFIELRKGVD